MATRKGDPPLPPTIHDPAHRVALSRVVSPRVASCRVEPAFTPDANPPPMPTRWWIEYKYVCVCVCVVKYAMTYKS